MMPLDFHRGLLSVMLEPMGDSCVECRHMRENQMPELNTAGNGCDFPDCNCHGLRE